MTSPSTTTAEARPPETVARVRMVPALGVPERRDAARTLAAIPCFNEELTVGGIVLRARQYVDEVVVIDDGSADRTAESAHLAGAIVLQHESNLGKGAAVRSAFRYAATNGFQRLVLLDGDGQHDPDEIPAVLTPLARPMEPSDVALGFRYGERTQMPIYRRMGKRVLDYATSISSGGPVTDSQCGFRAFGPRAIAVFAKRLRADRFDVESETVVLARDEGLRTENVPVTCRYEGVDGSTAHPVAHGTQVLNNVFVALTMRRPLLTLGLPGLALIVVAAYWTMRVFQTYDNAHVFVTSYALGAATFAILGGILIATALMLNMLILLRRSQTRGG